MKGKLGRLPLRSDMRALQFRSFLRRVAAEADPPADTTRFWKRRAPFPLRHFGNLQYGDCTIAKQAVAAMRMERLETRRTPRISDATVVNTYFAMTSALYGGGDTGAYETDALNNWRDPDRTFRDMSGRPLTIDAYLRVDAMDHVEVKRAIALSGAHGIAVCFNLPAAWQALDPPKVWDAPLAPATGPWEPGSWGGHCVAGDTAIPLLSGETVPICDLVGQRDVWVYGCLGTSQPVPAVARTIIRTKRSETLRVCIDDGTSLRTTPDHLWMMRDGSYQPADELLPGDRLMPLRRQIHHRGYEKVRWHDGIRRQAFTHRLVAEMLGANDTSIVTHHIDGNKRNNHPSNIMLGSQSDHVRLHRPWELSSLTSQPGWFATPAGREYCRTRHRDRDAAGRYIPATENHKVVAVERCREEWVYDLIDVSPTGNFAAGSVFIHNSMWAVSYNTLGPVVAHTWGLPPQQVTWEGAASYMDEAHLVIDSMDYWRKKKPAALKALKFADIRDAVNDVSSIRIA